MGVQVVSGTGWPALQLLYLLCRVACPGACFICPHLFALMAAPAAALPVLLPCLCYCLVYVTTLPLCCCLVLLGPPRLLPAAAAAAVSWPSRYSLTQETRALTKFLKCVDWTDLHEAKQVGGGGGRWVTGG